MFLGSMELASSPWFLVVGGGELCIHFEESADVGASVDVYSSIERWLSEVLGCRGRYEFTPGNLSVFVPGCFL